MRSCSAGRPLRPRRLWDSSSCEAAAGRNTRRHCSLREDSLMSGEGIPRTRREALRLMGAGFGMTAFAHAAASPWAPKPPHFAPKARRVIYIFLTGGLSAIDSFDHKPALDRHDGKPLPYPTPRTEFATGNLMRSPFEFTK